MVIICYYISKYSINLDEYKNYLMYYYCYIRINNILPIDYSIHNASISSTPYYEEIIKSIQSIVNFSKFPFLSNEKIYLSMLNKEPSLAESQYPTWNWNKVWGNYVSLLLNTYDKEIIYKHLHMCLATNKKLFSMNLISSSVCDKCTSDLEQTPIHMFYQCQYIQELFMWLLRILLYVCSFKPTSNIKCLYFDISYDNSQQKNVCNMFRAVYIVSIWRTRKENLRVAILKRVIVNKCLNIIDNIE